MHNVIYSSFNLRYSEIDVKKYQKTAKKFFLTYSNMYGIVNTKATRLLKRLNQTLLNLKYNDYNNAINRLHIT